MPKRWSAEYSCAGAPHGVCWDLLKRGWTGMSRDAHGPRTYLCVVDVMSMGQFAALEVEAPDALTAERMALQTLGDRYECIEVLDIVRTDDFVRAR